jgi:hypothetical protein
VDLHADGNGKSQARQIDANNAKTDADREKRRADMKAFNEMRREGRLKETPTRRR